MRKRLKSLRKQGIVEIEMMVNHKLPFDNRMHLHGGNRYEVDEITASYLVNGFYANFVGGSVNA